MSSAMPSMLTSANLLVDYNSSDARFFFHIYIGVVLVLIGIVGDRCCASRVKLQLLRGNSVRMTHMTGWLSNFDIPKAIWNLRTLPAGWIGLLMILTSILFIADTLVIATLIRTEVLQSRCTFGKGMVISTTPLDRKVVNTITSVVPYNGQPAVVAAQAQTVSQANGGLPGIYRKVNRSLKFSAAPVDVLGTWYCAPYGAEMSFAFNEESRLIAERLLSSGLLYDSTTSLPGCQSNFGPNEYSHLVILSPSVATTGYFPFDVRISIDLSAHTKDEKVMKTFQCKATGPGVDNILSRIGSATTLQDWCETFQGALYNGKGTPARPDMQNILAEYLNTMTMVAGGDDYLLNSSLANETQGCLVSRTSIGWAVFALVGATSILLLVLFLCWIVLLSMTNKAKRARRVNSQMENGFNRQAEMTKIKVIGEDTPGNVLEWMTQAARESKDRPNDRTEVKSKDLKTLKYGHVRDDQFPYEGVLFERPREKYDHASRSTSPGYHQSSGHATFTSEPLLYADTGFVAIANKKRTLESVRAVD